MKPILRLIVVLIAGVASAAAGPDTRQLVQLPDPMRQHMLANMRDHLLAITEIQRALGGGDFDQAATIAENRLGMSSLGSHGASHMARFMPQPMQAMGTGMHRAASQFARAAQEALADNDVRRAVAALSRVTEQCVACHAAYRTQ